MLDSCSTDNLSIEIYKNQFFKFDFTYIHVYLFRLSFLITLNIYKDFLRIVSLDEKVIALVVVSIL